MKKLVLGVLAGAGIAYLAYKLAEEGKLDRICDDLNDLAGKTKKRVKDGIDVGINQVEYLKDRALFKSEQAKDFADEISDKVAEKLRKAKG